MPFISLVGDAAKVRESTLVVYDRFLIKSLSVKEEHIQDVSVNLLSQLRVRFLQVKYSFVLQIYEFLYVVLLLL